MRQARPVFAGKFPVVPKAGKFAILVLVITHRTAKMAANVANGLDLALKFVQQYVVVFDPASELSSLFQLFERSEKAVIGLPFILNINQGPVSSHIISHPL